MHALVIEDELLLAVNLKVALQRLGYASVECVPTEADGVAAAQRRRPDIITADVRLREGSGVSAALRICEDGPLPVVFVTGNADALREHPNAVILDKPFSERDLAACIEDAIRNPFGLSRGGDGCRPPSSRVSA